MTLVVSTSSPWASVALFGRNGLMASKRSVARRSASCAVATMTGEVLRLVGGRIGELEAFVADVGPGSFSGVKVGVTMVKTWGWSTGAPVGGMSAFDLVDPEVPVALPVRRGLWLMRTPGEEPVPVAARPEGALGYDWDGEDGCPDAAKADLSRAVFVAPARLLPAYLVEPSISVPKDPSVLRRPE